MTLIDARRIASFDEFIQDVSEIKCDGSENIKCTQPARELIARMLSFLKNTHNSPPIRKNSIGFITFIALMKEYLLCEESLQVKDSRHVLAIKLGICIKIFKYSEKEEAVYFNSINKGNPMVITMQEYEGNYWMLYDRKEVINSDAFDSLKEKTNEFSKDNKELSHVISVELLKYISWEKDENEKYFDYNKLISAVIKGK